MVEMALASQKSTLWSNEEVQTFLCIEADDGIQRKLDGAHRNERIFQEVAKQLSAHGYNWTVKPCREKLKKMKCDYRAVKDHNSRSGVNQMDAIYGHRPVMGGRWESTQPHYCYKPWMNLFSHARGTGTSPFTSSSPVNMWHVTFTYWQEEKEPPHSGACHCVCPDEW
ncbi:zinc finger and SCAN domain-containing protein 32-like [Pholidichthys leucotaenia]